MILPELQTLLDVITECWRVAEKGDALHREYDQAVSRVLAGRGSPAEKEKRIEQLQRELIAKLRQDIQEFKPADPPGSSVAQLSNPPADDVDCVPPSPGPWTIRGTPFLVEDGIEIGTAYDRLGSPVPGVMLFCGPFMTGTVHANVSLIIAAPMLLLEAQLIKARLEQPMPLKDPDQVGYYHTQVKYAVARLAALIHAATPVRPTKPSVKNSPDFK